MAAVELESTTGAFNVWLTRSHFEHLPTSHEVGGLRLSREEPQLPLSRVIKTFCTLSLAYHRHIYSIHTLCIVKFPHSLLGVW